MRSCSINICDVYYNACVGVVLCSDFCSGKNAYTAAALNCTFVNLSWWSKNTCFENADAQNVFYYCLCGITCICIFFVKPNVYYCTHWTKHWKVLKKYTLLISHDFLRSYLNGSNAMVCFQEVILNNRAILTRICTFFNHKSS